MISNNKLLANLSRGRKPITADVFLTDSCNNKCPYCTYARYGDRTGTHMTFEQFRQYITTVTEWGVRGVILTGGGEPTVNPDFAKITGWLEDERIAYGINTNFNRYFEFSPRYLKVSLDAWDEDSYKRARGVRAYGKTVENIKKYIEYRNEAGSKTRVGIQMCATSEEDVRRFYEANKELPVDYIVIRPMESTLCEYYKEYGHQKTAEGILELLKGLRRTDERVKINYKWYELHNRFDECYAHWAQLAINEKGELMYCCHKPYETICHVLDKDAREKYYTAETNMAMCDIPCRLTGPNNTMREILSIDEPEFL